MVSEGEKNANSGIPGSIMLLTNIDEASSSQLLDHEDVFMINSNNKINRHTHLVVLPSASTC